MPQIPLNPSQRRSLRADAHHLNPVVLIGSDGLTPAVTKEVDAALNAHGLIKVRVFSDERSNREAILATLTDTLNAASVQHIGKLLVLWRPIPPKTKAEGGERGRGPSEVKVVKNSKLPGQKPEIQYLRVLGNQRLTAGGNVKKAKPRKTSVKKRNLG
ncbi:YhbY family RNA-binding protein [Corticibacter populi]|uniref:YhbY family RNA-binding protein n=1 Tax=Corticibacter populi TaxID=1550736 RepID=A0A3M6QXX9_9BURK|nr:YhbY family RNA-binding protein [Corticibacter populi]RMX07867.1 YhbY family RNA-binding protein [Corticibacter populi]RZS35103.1 putative YhbY family RNA-binding protein [Corticibacter populi]